MASLSEIIGPLDITVRKALDGLVSEGLLTRRQGAGAFVAGRGEKNFFEVDLVLGGHDRARGHAAS